MIGSDKNNIQYYLAFGFNYNGIEETDRQDVKEALQIFVEFIASRKKKWALIYFHDSTMMGATPINIIKSIFDKFREEDVKNLVAFITLYVGRIARFMGGFGRMCKGGSAHLSHLSYENLHEYLKNECEDD